MLSFSYYRKMIPKYKSSIQGVSEELQPTFIRYSSETDKGYINLNYAI